MAKKASAGITKYQGGVIALLALVQFTIILDFMVMAPLGDILGKSMDLNSSEFGIAVSAYAFSAGFSGLVAAGFADKYDRKKLQMFFYGGFIVGTALCATASSYSMLLLARVVTGLFAGVLGAVSMAIIADLFSFEQRGRVMGFVQMSFAVSQVAGIPIGLKLATRYQWHAPFTMIVGLSVATALFILFYLRPVTKHMEEKTHQNPLRHMMATLTNRAYTIPFATTALLSIGGFLLMPFSTQFLVNNVGVHQDHLPNIYFVMGLCSMVTLPLVGKISDKLGKFPTFVGGSILAMIMVIIYTNLPPVAVWQVILVSALMFAGVMSRMIPSSALMTAVPSVQDRGAFMSVNSSLQQIAGGIAAFVAGKIVVVQKDRTLLHFNTLGYLCVGVMVICGFLMYIISRRVAAKENVSVKIEKEQVAIA